MHFGQGFVKGEELSLLSWLAGEVCWLAVEVLSPCQNKSKNI